jgi:murein DD-endopeptidase MepM/ murein hydrolase activator NlpD
MMIALMILALSLSGSAASADIYRYLNAEGVECFTDTPTAGNAVRIVKEKKEARRGGSKRAGQSVPSSAAVPGPADNGPSPAAVHMPSETDCRLPVPGRISSTIGLRHDPIDGIIRDHKGVDIATPEGTPVRPVAPGLVVFSGYRPGYGNTVIVRHEDGTVTLYAHNSTNLKSAGEPVDRGSTIAFSGSTGRTTGPHLHFEAWKDGVNMTASFISGAASGDSRRTGDGIRRIVQADGTLLFTNY